jgi:hypothetical protein
MNIEKVITETILAVYQSSDLANHLFLKGGSALRIFDDQMSRLSIDADFSLKSGLVDADRFFEAILACVETRFQKFGFDVIDMKSTRKPKKNPENRPEWWGGWACEFKLVDHKHVDETLEMRRRNAFIPDGASSLRITIDISEHEYCGKYRTKVIDGVPIIGYSRELLVLEKMRAICQQHPDYPFRLSKNRSRDFYDIYMLTADVGDLFPGSCAPHLNKVFAAKEVPLALLKSIWDEDFMDEQRRGFDQVRDTVRGKVYDFDVYLEHLRFLIKDILPDISQNNYDSGEPANIKLLYDKFDI